MSPTRQIRDLSIEQKKLAEDISTNELSISMLGKERAMMISFLLLILFLRDFVSTENLARWRLVPKSKYCSPMTVN